MQITTSAIHDIDEIFRLYKIASDYQKEKKKVVVWPDFKRALVDTEIAEKRQWKLIIDDEVACLWAITFSDAQIWEERDNSTSIYIHRIATNPKFRGNNYMNTIVTWAKTYAQSIEKRFIRLDTLGNNTKLIEHYQKAGFDFLGMFDLKNTDMLSDHYQDQPACLFEIDLGR
ncbi:GNAT family N-acetyltransferase [Cellulophaga baltica]|uniref:GNAT family acetyltransferase n=1 Tax=Cellulophaga baltica 18 TaxID=1348584 RepID=A0AAU8RK17_9FLAO|nr:GNAT family N-acetyltransferase [Cellulophaga baltica]AIZ43296.1 GNAT family acetyltransferase [Cellulophaga baltica 18]